MSKNDVPAWERVLHFGTRCLRIPAGCGRRLSFAPQGNKQLREEEEDPPTLPRPSRRGEGKGRDPMEVLVWHVPRTPWQIGVMQPLWS